MKKVLIVLTLMLTLGMSVQAASQKHRHTPRGTELVDTTKQTSGVDAFSDTTSIDSVDNYSFDDEWDSDDPVEEAIGKVFERISGDSKMMTGMIIAVVAIVVIFLVAPVLILLLIFYFVNKNRKQKMKLAQMAMEKGQPIPENLLNNQPDELGDEYQKGMRQCFVGVGLMIFLWYAAGSIGFGIGALVFCIGLGKVFAAKSVGRKNQDINNDLKQQDYD
jgi:hypothetical protein